MIRPPPRSTLFPYPPLFRSLGLEPPVPRPSGRAYGVVQIGMTRAKMLATLKALIVKAALMTVLIIDRKSTRLNSSHSQISYAVFCLKKKRYQRSVVLRLTLA